MELILRAETARDVDGISSLLRAAFSDHPHSNNREYRLVQLLRAQAALRIALVAQVDGELVGCVHASPAHVGGEEGWICLAPLAVAPQWQGRGIGRTLLDAALAELEAAGLRGVVLVGEADYYRRSGFQRIAGVCAAGIPDEYVLALPWLGQPQGEIVFHPAFAALADDVAGQEKK